MSNCCKNSNEFFSSITDVEFFVPFAPSRKARFGFPCPSARMSVCVTLRLSACISASRTGRIFAKFDIGNFVNKLYVSLK